MVLRALARLVAGGDRVRLVIAGQGDHAGALARLRDELGLGGVVDMPGFVDENTKRELLRRAWVHVLTSPKEGWGIVNIEAAACGTPTVASDSPGLRDSVIDGVTGLLVPHGDVDALAAALTRVLRDDRLRHELSEQARQFATRFTWERSADLTEAHLEKAMTGNARRTDRRGTSSPYR